MCFFYLKFVWSEDMERRWRGFGGFTRNIFVIRSSWIVIGRLCNQLPVTSYELRFWDGTQMTTVRFATWQALIERIYTDYFVSQSFTEYECTEYHRVKLTLGFYMFTVSLCAHPLFNTVPQMHISQSFKIFFIVAYICDHLFDLCSILSEIFRFSLLNYF